MPLERSSSLAGGPEWAELLSTELVRHREGFIDVVGLAGLKTIREFYEKTPDYGDLGWTVWTLRRVYFPSVYDGDFAVASVPRHPCGEVTGPVGGGG